MTSRSLRLLAIALGAIALAACREEKVCASADQLLCDGTCRAVQTDPASCGACGHACAVGEQCAGGLCRCANGLADCAGACVDVRSDPEHCGACGAACAGETLCTTDGAGATSCRDACALPSQTACGRACVELATDAQHCGACDRACGTNERCEAGLCVADLYVACFNSDEVREATRDLAPAGLPIAVEPGPSALAFLADALYVTSSRPGGRETLSVVRRGTPAVHADELFALATPAPDIQALAIHGGLLYLSHASAGTLLVLAPDGRVVDEVTLAPPEAGNQNPQGIAFVGDDAYVALNGGNPPNVRSEVVVLDVSREPACASGAALPPCATELARIDAQPLASAGAFARPSALAAGGGRVYAALWNLDANFTPPLGSTGRLAVIDAATHALDRSVVTGGVAGVVDLGPGCLNPADLAVHGGTLWVTCGAFDFSAFPAVGTFGAGVVPVDVSGAVPVPGAVLPAGGGTCAGGGETPCPAPGKLAFCGGAGYVGDQNSGRVFRLDPAAGIVDGVELCPPSGGFALVSDLACGF